MLSRFAYSFASKGVVALLNFAILLYSARYLGLRTRGDISIFLLNIAIVQFINEVFAGNTLVHFLKNYTAKRIMQQALLFTLIIATLAAVILPRLSSQLSVSTPAYFLIISAVLLHSLFCVVILALGNLSSYNRIAILQPSLLLVFIILQINVFKGYTFQHYFYSLLLSFLAALPFSIFKVAQLIKIDGKSIQHSTALLFRNGLFLQTTALMIFLMNRYNYYLLSENSKVGLYATACTLLEALLLTANSTVPVLLSTLSKQNQTGSFLISVVKIVLLFMLPLLALVLLVPESVYVLVLGSGFMGVKEIMLAYAPAVIFQGMCIVVAQYFSASAKQIVLVKAYLPAFILTVLLAPFAIAQWGYSGAALLSGVCFLVAFLTLYITYCKQTHTSFTSIFKKESMANLLRVLKT